MSQRLHRNVTAIIKHIKQRHVSQYILLLSTPSFLRHLTYYTCIFIVKYQLKNLIPGTYRVTFTPWIARTYLMHSLKSFLGIPKVFKDNKLSIHVIILRKIISFQYIQFHKIHHNIYRLRPHFVHNVFIDDQEKNVLRRNFFKSFPTYIMPISYSATRICTSSTSSAIYIRDKWIESVWKVQWSMPRYIFTINA